MPTNHTKEEIQRAELLENAPMFDVHKWSDFPEVKLVTDAIFEEIKALRKSKQIRIKDPEKIKKHLRIFLIELWSASKLGINPYRSISLNKTNYHKESRYRKLFLTYNFTIGIIDDLLSLEYVELYRGFRGDKNRMSRIKATDKLINKILDPEYGIYSIITKDGCIAIVGSQGERKSIYLKDEKDNSLDFKDTKFTKKMKMNLVKINRKIASARIALEIKDSQFKSLIKEINTKKDPQKRQINFTSTHLYRVFNNGSWKQGGRFYGGWWQGIPSQYRKYITINHKPTEELDYSGHHIRMLYANDNLDPPEEAYDVKGFDREDQKTAMLIMLNANDETKAAKAIAKEGIKNAKSLIKALKKRHDPIKRHFLKGVGLKLMNQDSKVAEKVMLQMLKLGHVVLPVHDSFIVRNSASHELETIMKEVFEEEFGRKAKLKVKKTMLEDPKPKQLYDEDGAVTMDLERFFTYHTKYYSRYLLTWGF